MSPSHTAVLLEAFAPLPRSLALSLPTEATAADILSGIEAALCDASSSTADTSAGSNFYLTSSSSAGRVLAASSRPLDQPNDADLVVLRVHARMLGGKGGFGSMLRAAGGKMSAKQGQGNTDSCRDLNGRRLSVMKEAKALATYIENEPARLKALNDAQQKKYAKLERMLGRQPKAAADFEEAARRLADAEEQGEEEVSDEDRGEGSSQSTASRSKGGIGSSGSGGPSFAGAAAKAPAPVAGIKRKERIEDREYVEQSREIVENVRSAVAAAMMKKRKKTNKVVAAAAAASSSSTSTSTAGTSATKTAAAAPAPAPAPAPATAAAV
ncbi:hypothetical protein OC835_000499 [Tilletia horrida]|nr:hypothetical protein OC835_000499 [Tilletia horrida]